MKRLMTSVFMAALGLGLVLAQAATAQERTAENQDQQFVRKAATGGLAEVQLGQMALQRAASPEVKQFAQEMVDDHTKANNELMQIAQAQNMTVPKSLEPYQHAMATVLGKLQGNDFDLAYLAQQVEVHELAVQLYMNQANHGENAALKTFASKTLPTLRAHLHSAQNLMAKHQGPQAQR